MIFLLLICTNREPRRKHYSSKIIQLNFRAMNILPFQYNIYPINSTLMDMKLQILLCCRNPMACAIEEVRQDDHNGPIWPYDL